MDTIEVAFLKNDLVINVLVFKSSAPDTELNQFKENLNADSFKRLADNEIVRDGVIFIPAKPDPISGIEWVWSQENKTWDFPKFEYPAPVLSGEALERELESELDQN